MNKRPVHLCAKICILEAMQSAAGDICTPFTPPHGFFGVPKGVVIGVDGVDGVFFNT